VADLDAIYRELAAQVFVDGVFRWGVFGAKFPKEPLMQALSRARIRRGGHLGGRRTREALGACDVVLFADAYNPVSNRVYRRIGFVPAAEHVEIELTVRSEAATARCSSPSVSGRTWGARPTAGSSR
jgi:hypothetical protein